jgi:prepilin-type processing-associated H-X9-DG protein
VVIAIIALLVSILLPSLQSAKEMAKTAVCISTMKGLGTSLAQYNTNNKDGMPFSFFYRNSGEMAFWPHALIEDGVLSDGLKMDEEEDIPEQSVLRCASDIPEVHPNFWGSSANRGPDYRKDKDRMKVQALYRTDKSGTTEYYTHTSYGANGCNTESSATYWNWAMPIKWNHPKSGKDVFKLPQFKIAPSEVVAMYDGVFSHVTGADMHSQRHNTGKNINILACDGHAESLPTDQVSAPDDNVYGSDGLHFDRNVRPGNWFLSRDDMPGHAYSGGGL